MLIAIRSISLSKVRSLAAFLLMPGLALLTAPILARMLTPSQRGEYAAILQPITVATAVAAIGFPTAISYFISAGADAKKTFRQGFLLHLPLLVIVTAVAYLYAFAIAQRLEIPLWIIWTCWVAIPLGSVVQLRRSYHQGLSHWLILDLERAGFALARFIPIVALAIIGVQMAGAYALASIAAFVVAAMFLWWPQKTSFASTTEAPNSRNVLNYAATSGVATIAVVANSRLDQAILPALATSEEIGYYAVAVTLAEVPLMIGVLIARNLLTMSAAGATSADMLREIRFFAVTALLLACSIAALAPVAVPMVFGPEYAASVHVAQILCLSVPSNVVAIAAVSVLLGRRRNVSAAWVAGSGVLVTVVSYLFLRDMVDALAAAWVAVISQGVSALVASVLVRRTAAPVNSAPEPVRKGART